MQEFICFKCTYTHFHTIKHFVTLLQLLREYDGIKNTGSKVK